MITNNPEGYSSAKLNMEGVVKSLANTISPDSNKNLISIYNSFWVRKETIDVINEFYSKMRENGIIVYDSAQAAAKNIQHFLFYGNYLRNRGNKIN